MKSFITSGPGLLCMDDEFYLYMQMDIYLKLILE